MIHDEVQDPLRADLLDPAITGLPIRWLAPLDAVGVHNERIDRRLPLPGRAGDAREKAREGVRS
jgi:hypothetical protein